MIVVGIRGSNIVLQMQLTEAASCPASVLYTLMIKHEKFLYIMLKARISFDMMKSKYGQAFNK